MRTPLQRSVTFIMLILLLAHQPGVASSTTDLPAGKPALIDSDADGLDDELEGELGTDPYAADTDGDGYDDKAEILGGSDPNNPKDWPIGNSVFVGGQTVSKSMPPKKYLPLPTLYATPSNPTGTQPSLDQEFQSVRYYAPPSAPEHTAADLWGTNFKAGAYVLTWQHRTTINTNSLLQTYTVTIKLEGGRTILIQKTPFPVGQTWKKFGVSFELLKSDEGLPLRIQILPDRSGPEHYVALQVCVLKAGLEVDADRDGVIAPEERPPVGKPFRFWINDDHDEGECQERADKPGETNGSADASRPGVNGLRDLVDFFAVNLNILPLARLFKPSEGYRYFLRNEDAALQTVETCLDSLAVDQVHRDPDILSFTADGIRPLSDAIVGQADKRGRIEVSRSFIERIAKNNQGVILVEASKGTTKPLVLEIEEEGAVVASLELSLAIGPVEAMYRHVSLNSDAKDFSGRPVLPSKAGRKTEVGEPSGLPDAETNGRWFALIHGYNVDAESARGWHAETFKRLYVLGCQARFVGVTWNGDTGLDYHKAVFHAFQSGDQLSRKLGFLDPARTTLAAHSLGNVVACQSIQAGFTPARYLLLNAAIPTESITGFTGDETQLTQMTEKEWRGYGRRLFASDWYKIFATSDRRSNYAWTNCFSRVSASTILTNFYSPGEDITICPAAIESASVLATAWSGRTLDYGAWKTQEMLKGVGWTRSLASVAMERTQGGWGFNGAWRGRFVQRPGSGRGSGHYERMTPLAAGRIGSTQLIADPFFRPFSEGWLHATRRPRPSPLLDDSLVRYDLLARGIPAVTFAAGAVPLSHLQMKNAMGESHQDINLEIKGRVPKNRWPTDAHQAVRAPSRWLHSDYKNAALPFVFPLFELMINQTKLP
jgi:hypothetical protein